MDSADACMGHLELLHCFMQTSLLRVIAGAHDNGNRPVRLNVVGRRSENGRRGSLRDVAVLEALGWWLQLTLVSARSCNKPQRTSSA